jgi:hypothetical protein
MQLILSIFRPAINKSQLKRCSTAWSMPSIYGDFDEASPIPAGHAACAKFASGVFPPSKTRSTDERGEERSTQANGSEVRADHDLTDVPRL